MKFIHSFRLHETEIFADIIIHADGSLIKRCHSSILSVRSGNFLKILNYYSSNQKPTTLAAETSNVNWSTSDINVHLNYLLPEIASQESSFINLPSEVNKRLIVDLIENIYCSSESTSPELEVQAVNHLKSFITNFDSLFTDPRLDMDSKVKSKVKDAILDTNESLIQSKSANSDSECNHNPSREDSGFSSQSAKDDSTTEDELPKPRGLVRSNTFDLICKQTDVELTDINNGSNSINNPNNPMVRSEILSSGKSYSSVGHRSSSVRPKSSTCRKNKSDLMRKSSLENSSYFVTSRGRKGPTVNVNIESDRANSPSGCRSPGSIFQFFVDMDKLPLDSRGTNRSNILATSSSAGVRRGSESVIGAFNSSSQSTDSNVNVNSNSNSFKIESSASKIVPQVSKVGNNEARSGTEVNQMDEKSPAMVFYDMKSELNTSPKDVSSHESQNTFSSSTIHSPHPERMKKLAKVNESNNKCNLGGHRNGGTRNNESSSSPLASKVDEFSKCHTNNGQVSLGDGRGSQNVLVVTDERLVRAKHFTIGKSLIEPLADECEPINLMSTSMSRSFMSTTSSNGNIDTSKTVQNKLGHRSRIASHHRANIMSTSWTQETRSGSSASSMTVASVNSSMTGSKIRGQSPAMSTSSTADLTNSIVLPSGDMMSSSMMKSRSSQFSMDRSLDRSSNCNSPSMVASMTRSVLRRSSSKVRNSKLDEERISRTFESVSKLGDDLLKMFINQINPDLTIECIPEAFHVMDESTHTSTIEPSSSSKQSIKKIRAHKSILASRSPYFNAMFTGNWMEKSSSTIQMVGFSYDVVYYALCHMYSGTIMLPTNIEISEIALISDLLGLTTLRDTVIHELKMTFCHFFHKPCKECSIGVLDCLVLSHTCQLWDLKGQCLTWLGKHWTRIWPTKPFSSLSQYEPLHDECYMSTLETVTVESVIETMLSCERLITTMPRVKWAESIFNLVNLLMNQCTEYVTDHFDSVLSSKSFISLSRGRDWNIQTIEEPFINAISAINCDIACKSLVQLTSLIEASLADTGFGYGPYTESFSSLIRKLYRNMERFLIHHADHAITCSSWNLLSNEAKVRIRESAVMVYEFEKPHAPKPMLSSSLDKSSGSTVPLNGDSRPSTGSPIVRRKNSSRISSSNSDHNSYNSNDGRKSNCEEQRANRCLNATGGGENSGLSVTSSPSLARKKGPQTMGKVHHRSRNIDSSHHQQGKQGATSPISGNDSCGNSITSDKGGEGPSSSSSSNRPPSRIPLTSLANTPTNVSKRKTSQVAKVLPFNLKKVSANSASSATPSTISGATTSSAGQSSTSDPANHEATGPSGDLVVRSNLADVQAEMDAESTLVQNCLAEAQLLEQELSRKLKQYQVRIESTNKQQATSNKPPSASSSFAANRAKVSSPSIIPASPSRSLRPKSSNSSSANTSQSSSSNNNTSSKSINPFGLTNRPPFK